jgi:two-component system invasion response regulator UvrY
MKVILAEDHSIVIRGIKIMFETEFPNYALDVVKTGNELLSSLKKNTYQLAIIDLQLLDGDTLHLLKNILNIYENLNILVFTANSEEIFAHNLYKEGIKGFLNKQAPDAEVLTAIKTTLEGKIYLSDNYKNILFSNEVNKKTQNPFLSLSQRELEIINLLLQGKRTQDICNELNLQPSTISTFKSKIFTKLNVTNVIELSILAKNFSFG